LGGKEGRAPFYYSREELKGKGPVFFLLGKKEEGEGRNELAPLVIERKALYRW